MHAIQIDNLKYRPGRGFALSDLSIQVPTGSVFGFLGANGAGKTTTIKLVLGLLKPQAGYITVLGHPIPKQSADALLKIGYVPEAPHLYESLTVEQIVGYHSVFYPSWDEPLAAQLLNRFDLHVQQKVRSLSKGETRKLMMLLALSQRPSLLVLDEPTDGLDPVIRRDILDALGEAVRHEHVTIFLSSHLVHELELICDHLAIVDKGNLITQMTVPAFRDDIKRLNITNADRVGPNAPFSVLRKTPPAENAEVHEWVVKGWQPSHTSFFGEHGAEVTAVHDMDLENGYVELLRSFRSKGHGE